ncbi:hypothetical protein ACELLULO517_27470 [Acidisoma cellulosilytica]|uniref:Uncharacterized protein n=1 Tax=Acidisoma cellulosilyticum TaxID=2802395 RepID=A0A963Z7I6_9PROT|nr:hypothetical protein [Acidisoma cellulosilyticum]MCB8884008.1 hypothetical protein [Acidisoma cellulosilyticum]
MEGVMTMCFIDTMAPASPAQRQAWQAVLDLQRDHQRAPRIMFRKACNGAPPADNLMSFLQATVVSDEGVMVRIGATLTALAQERVT